MISTRPRKQEDSPAQHRMLRALVIAPEKDKRLAQIFDRCGYQADFIEPLKQAFHLDLPSDYDLLCIEVRPGDSRSLELITLFRQHNPDADVVTITTDNQKWLEAKVRALKVSYHLVFPCSATEIISILDHLAARRKG